MREFCERERERRRMAVAWTAGCNALEGYRASPAQLALHKRYIDGELEIEDMLEIVRRNRQGDLPCLIEISPFHTIDYPNLVSISTSSREMVSVRPALISIIRCSATYRSSRSSK